MFLCRGTRPRTASLAILVGIMCALPAAAQQPVTLNSSWIASSTGESVQVNPDGSFEIANIRAADRFGPGGLGTRPDFVSDLAVRVGGISRSGGLVKYFVSEPFRFRQGETVFVRDLTVTFDPATLPEADRRAFVASLTISSGNRLMEVGATAQATVTLELIDGLIVDATAASQQTVYRTSNPDIATVDENGFISALSVGLVGIAATNMGATSAEIIRVVATPTDPLLTTVEGFVQFADGSPASSVQVTAIAGPSSGSGATDLTGLFSIPGIIVSDATVSVTASATVGGNFVSAEVFGLPPIANGLTDAGILKLNAGDQPSELIGQAIFVRNIFQPTRELGRIEVLDFQDPCGPARLSTLDDQLGIGEIFDLAITPDGSRAVLAHPVSVTTVNLLSVPPSIVGSVPLPTLGFPGDVSIACTGNGLAVVAAAFSGPFFGGPDMLATVDVATQTIISTLSVGRPDSSGLSFVSLDVSPDNSLVLLSFSRDSTVRPVLLTPTGELIDTGACVHSGGGNPSDIKISPNGRLALVANIFPPAVGVLDITGGSVSLRESIPLERAPVDFVFTPDGRTAYVAGAGQISVLEIDAFDNVTDTGTRIAGTQDVSFFGESVALTADARHLLAIGTGGISVIDVATNTIVRTESVVGSLRVIAPLPTPIDAGIADCNGNGLRDECETTIGGAFDCNGNGIPDSCDISDLASGDCNLNGVPDECEDCNGNRVADECDLATGTSADCDLNNVPDECEDCNFNGVGDLCDIVAGTSVDCNANNIPDECEIDCNRNGVDDVCDVAAGTSIDCNSNNLPDECEADCNRNGIADECDILAGTSADCNFDGIPDACALDCNANTIPDPCDIVAGTSFDVVGLGAAPDGIPDECQIDCNLNSIPDQFDLTEGSNSDCNINSVPDECDILSATSQDCDGNSVPDECDIGGVTGTDCNGNRVPDACDIFANDCDGDLIPDDCLVASAVSSQNQCGGQASDGFGQAVGVRSDVALIGARNSGLAGTLSGAAFVLRFDGTGWNEEAKLIPSDATFAFFAGSSVAMGNNFAILGTGGFGNAAYLFRFDGLTWIEEVKLTASLPEFADGFGGPVAASDDVVIVGGTGRSGTGLITGAAYVFRFDGTMWTEEAVLIASDAAVHGEFGAAVAIDGNRAVIGSPGDNSTGSAYVFAFDGTAWNQEAKLTAPDVAVHAAFGVAVDISGGRVVIGASGDDDGGSASGSAYIFAFDGIAWNQEVKLTASNADTNDSFGSSVALEGNLAIVGAPFGDHGASNSGAAYAFRKIGTAWLEHAKLGGDNTGAFAQFGMAVALSGNRAVIGALNGQAYVLDIPERDCNANGNFDACDIDSGTSLDINSNGIPDECEP